MRDERSGLWGYVGAVPPRYAQAQPFADGVAWVRRPEAPAWELIDETGEPLIDASAGYLAAGRFAEGLAWVSRDQQAGWFAIDRRNRVIVPGGFDDAKPFHRGLALVRRGGWGAIDRHGQVVVQPRYRGFATALVSGGPIDGFTDEGLAVVDAGDRYGVVDRTGRLIVAPVHAAVRIHPAAFLIADKYGLWGALNRDGDPLVELKYKRPRRRTGRDRPACRRPAAGALTRLRAMEFRHLGRSGLLISEIAYGNWITHGLQVEEDAATACVRAALDEGITTFDTADAYASGRAEEVLGRALKGERRAGLEIFTKVFWPTGPGPNDRSLSRKHIMESIDASLSRLQTDYVDLYQAHRYDYSTPLEETMQAFADVVRQGKALYIGVSEWTASEIRAGWEMAQDLKIPFVSNQPQYSVLWRVIEAEVVPTSIELGVGQVVFSPIAQGVLTGKYQVGQARPEGSRATAEAGADFIKRYLTDDVLGAVAKLKPLADQAGLSMAQLAVAWVLQNSNVSAAIIGATRPEQVRDNVKASGVRLDADLMKAIDEALDPVAERDPAKTVSPARRP